MIITGKQVEISVRQEGERVVILRDGQLALDLPYEAALSLAKAIRIKALQAEEQANAEAIVFDQALLFRLGVPLGLTGNRDIKREAVKESAWNADLRRYIGRNRTKGIRSSEAVGTPTIIGGSK